MSVSSVMITALIPAPTQQDLTSAHVGPAIPWKVTVSPVMVSNHQYTLTLSQSDFCNIAF